MRHDIEEYLLQTSGPRVAARAHRAILKRRLLQSMRENRSMVMTRRMAIAACCLAMLLATSGWAAHTVYLKFFVVDTEMKMDVVDRDGNVTTASSMTTVLSNDTDFTREDAVRQWPQVKRTIEQGRYTLVEVMESESGGLVYIYGVRLEDGSTTSFGASEPLATIKEE